MANATGAWIEFLYLKVTRCYVTRWTQNSKENISNINRRNKRNTRSTIVFQECLKSPKCLIAACISWREESAETEGEIIFGNDYVDRLYQDEPLVPPDARLDAEDDEETDQDGLSMAVFEARYLRQVAVESW